MKPTEIGELRRACHDAVNQFIQQPAPPEKLSIINAWLQAYHRERELGARPSVCVLGRGDLSELIEAARALMHGGAEIAIFRQDSIPKPVFVFYGIPCHECRAIERGIWFGGAPD